MFDIRYDNFLIDRILLNFIYGVLMEKFIIFIFGCLL